MSEYFFNSGLYEKQFYTKHRVHFKEYAGEVGFNRNLLTMYYENDPGLDYDYKGEYGEWDQVAQILSEKIGHGGTYFEPLIFNEEIALECGLTPFYYDNINMLALPDGIYDVNLLPKLDAYQILTHNTIDKNSILFSDAKRFEDVVGKEITEKVLKILEFTNLDLVFPINATKALV